MRVPDPPGLVNVVTLSSVNCGTEFCSAGTSTLFAEEIVDGDGAADCATAMLLSLSVKEALAGLVVLAHPSGILTVKSPDFPV